MSVVQQANASRGHSIWKVVVSVGLLMAAGLLAVAQPPTPSVQPAFAFDVVSIRQNLAGENAQGADAPHVNFPIGSDDAYYKTNGVFSATNLPLISYLIFAYKPINIRQRQALFDSTPEWVKSEHYNIEARTDRPNVSKDEMRQMMQTLLQQRFNLAVHREIRTTNVYAAELISPGKLGPQLRPHSKTAHCPESSPNPSPISGATMPKFAFDSSGFPQVCGRFVNSIASSIKLDRRYGGGALPMPTIVGSISGVGNLDRPVVDRTGLTGLYDFVLEFLPDPPQGQQYPADAEGLDVIRAVRTQLGIKLVTDTAPIEFVLVDHISHPTPN